MHNIGLCRYLSRFVCLHVYTFTDDADAQYPAQPKDPFIIHTYKRPEDAGSFLWARFMLVEPVERQMLADVTEQIQKGDVKIVFFTIRMYLTARALRKRFPKLSFLYISHNCEYANVRADLRLYDRAHNVKGLLHMLKMFRANGFCLAEKNCIRMAERIFSISPSDSEQLSERYHADREHFSSISVRRIWTHPGILRRRFSTPMRPEPFRFIVAQSALLSRMCCRRMPMCTGSTREITRIVWNSSVGLPRILNSGGSSCSVRGFCLELEKEFLIVTMFLFGKNCRKYWYMSERFH